MYINDETHRVIFLFFLFSLIFVFPPLFLFTAHSQLSSIILRDYFKIFFLLLLFFLFKATRNEKKSHFLSFFISRLFPWDVIKKLFIFLLLHLHFPTHSHFFSSIFKNFFILRISFNSSLFFLLVI